MTVTGKPTLTLNDGGTASYVSGSGTNTLTFSYAVASGQNTPALQVTAVNGTIADLAGNALSTSNLPETFTGVVINTTTTPAVSSVVELPASGDLKAGEKVTLTLAMSENVTVNTAHGKPTLKLNDGGTATYIGGSGTNALTFSYTVAAGQNTAALAVTTVNLNGATITNGGNAANLSLAGLTQTGPQIDTIAPTAPRIGSDLLSGNVATLTGTAEAGTTVTVFDGFRRLGTATVNSSGTWSFATGSLAIGFHSFTATDTDAAGNVSKASASLSATVKGPVTASNPPSVTIVGGGTFEIGSASADTVTFAGSTGTLKLDAPSTFSGEIFNFRGNGTLSGSDQIDLDEHQFQLRQRYICQWRFDSNRRNQHRQIDPQRLLYVGKLQFRERRQRRHHRLRSAGSDVLQPKREHGGGYFRGANDWDWQNVRASCRRSWAGSVHWLQRDIDHRRLCIGRACARLYWAGLRLRGAERH